MAVLMGIIRNIPYVYSSPNLRGSNLDPMLKEFY
jgi:hypothetical protein